MRMFGAKLLVESPPHEDLQKQERPHKLAGHGNEVVANAVWQPSEEGRWSWERHLVRFRGGLGDSRASSLLLSKEARKKS